MIFHNHFEICFTHFKPSGHPKHRTDPSMCDLETATIPDLMAISSNYEIHAKNYF